MQPQLLPAKPEFEERPGRRCSNKSEPLSKDPASYLTCVVMDLVPHENHFGITGSTPLNTVWWSWR